MRGVMSAARGLLWLVAALAAVGLGSCARQQGSGQTASAPSAQLSVVVSIPPQAYFVRRVGGDRVSAQALVTPGQSPATYEPSPAQMMALDEADVYFRIGVPFETALMSRIQSAMPSLDVVDTRAGIQLRAMDGAGEGGTRDPHIWLNPRLVKVQAATIRDSLARHDPEGADQYGANLQALEADLDRLDGEMGATLAPVRGREMLVYHPAFGYLADAYGLRQVAIEVEGKEPTTRELNQIIASARAAGVKALFVQQQFASVGADAVAAEIGATVVRLDPLAEDYMTNMLGMARQIRDGLEGATGSGDH